MPSFSLVRLDSFADWGGRTYLQAESVLGDSKVACVLLQDLKPFCGHGIVQKAALTHKMLTPEPNV